MKERPSSTRLDAASVVLTCIVVLQIAALLLDQGGFKNLSTCMCGILSAVLVLVLTIRHRRDPGKSVPVIVVLFIAIALVYAVSTIVNTPTLTTISETGTWFALAAFAALIASLSPEVRQRCLTWVCWVGVATAIWGMLQCCGLLETTSAIENGRLQISFQYANTAGIWFGTLAFVVLAHRSAWLRAMAPLLMCALLLTQSGGALMVFTIGVVIFCIVRMRERRVEETCLLILSLIVAGVLMLAIMLTPNPASCLWVVMGAAVCTAYGLLQDKGRASARISAFLEKRVVLYAFIGFLCLAVLGMCVLFSGRIIEAISTFAERGAQMVDGSAFLLGHLVLGSGPDTWQYFFQYQQGSAYYASIMHNGYLQTAIDAGILAGAALVAIVIIGIMAAFRAKRLGCALALLVLALHAAIDFDLAFGAITFLLVLLCLGEDGPSIPLSRLALYLPTALACIVVCAYGAFCDFAKMQIAEARATGKYDTVVFLTTDNPQAEADCATRNEAVTALFALERYSEVQQLIEKYGICSDRQALLMAASQFERNQTLAASITLVDALKRQPYNHDLYITAQDLVNKYGIDPSLAAEFDELVIQAQARGLFA